MERSSLSRSSSIHSSSGRPVPAPALRVTAAPPHVATTITALGGQLRYRIYAYRALGHGQAMDVGRLGLRLGWIAEPPAGAEAVLYTSVGATEKRQYLGCAGLDTPQTPDRVTTERLGAHELP